MLLAIALGLGACKQDKTPAAAPPPSSKPSDPAVAPPAPAPAPATPPPAALGPNGLPKECDDYKQAIDELKKCPKLAPEAKDSIVQAYENASAGWQKLPESARRNLAATCKAAVDSVHEAGKTQCPQ